ncbi:glycosyltransferase 87 family protein [Janibacter sp. GXQ6167]|uniref:glycosyltransferase 87 family protein n=1 Tax=Janibacter sp. GXQ6167 TaxID=3240791 RepID=UPI0035244C0C
MTLPSPASGSSKSLSLTLTIVLVGALLLLAAGSKVPCIGLPTDSDRIVTHQCFTEVSTFYGGRGLAQQFTPFYGQNEGALPIEYPVGAALVMESAALATHAMSGIDASEYERRDRLSAEALMGDPQVERESTIFLTLVYLITGLVGGLGLVLTLQLVSARAAVIRLLLVSPVLIFSSFVNIDLLVLGSIGVALWAWARARPVLLGVAIGLGAAAKLVPALLLIGVVGYALARPWDRRRWREALMATSVAALSFVAINAPAALLNPDRWAAFWTFSSDRVAYFGSSWMALRMVRGEELPVSAMNLIAGLTWVAAALLGLFLASRVGRFHAMIVGALPAIVAFIDLNKVVSPQFSIWLVPFLIASSIPLALVATYTLAHAFHYLETWLYIKGITTPPQGIDKAYLAAIAGRVLADTLLVLWSVWYGLVRPTRSRDLGDHGG